MAKQSARKRHRSTGTTVYIDGKKYTLVRKRKGLYYTKYTTNVYELKKKLRLGESVPMYRYSKSAMKARSKYQQMSEIEKEYVRAASRARYQTKQKGANYGRTKKYQQIVSKLSKQAEELRKLGRGRTATNLMNLNASRTALFGQYSRLHPELTPSEIGSIVDDELPVALSFDRERYERAKRVMGIG